MIRNLLKKKVFWVIFIAVLVASFLIWKFIFNKKDNLDSAKIERGVVAEELVLSGEVKADKDASLKFSSSGKVAWVGVIEGDIVKKGQALAKLDTVYLNSALQSARASLRLYDATVDKVHDDVKNHSSDENLTQRDTRTTAEATKDKAYEAVVQAEDALRNSTLLSPFAGVVTYVGDYFPGVYALVSEKIVEVVDPDTIYFTVSADQNEVVKLKEKQKVKIVLDSYSDKELEGEVVYIGLTPKEGETGAVYDIKVKFNGGETNLLNLMKIGMTGDAKFVVSEKSDVLHVPPKFVSSDVKGKYLKVGDGNNKTYIETGLEGEERVEITGNIKEGDTVYE